MVRLTLGRRGAGSRVAVVFSMFSIGAIAKGVPSVTVTLLHVAEHCFPVLSDLGYCCLL